jgi:hypothetical protein
VAEGSASGGFLARSEETQRERDGLEQADHQRGKKNDEF